MPLSLCDARKAHKEAEIRVALGFEQAYDLVGKENGSTAPCPVSRPRPFWARQPGRPQLDVWAGSSSSPRACFLMFQMGIILPSD